MSLSAAEIEAVVKDLAPRLEGGKIERIDQPDRHRLILHIRRSTRRYWLQFVVHPRFSRLHLLTRRPEEGKPAGGFCNVVRRHITGSPVQRLLHVEGDRVVILHAVQRDVLLRPSPVRLIAELVGPGSNLILVDDSEKVLGAMFTANSPRRRVLPGGPYQPLPKPAVLPPKALVNRFEDVSASPDDELALSRAVHETYREMEAEAELDERRTSLRSVVRERQKALRARRAKLAADLERAQDAESLRRTGELLKIALPDLHKGQSSIVVQDLFDPDAPEVTIQLDRTIAPGENVERYFKQYKKLKAGRAHTEERLRESEEQLPRLDALEAELEAASALGTMNELAERISAEGIVLPEKRHARTTKAPAAGPRRFLSADGMEILVSHNRQENHELTFSVARGNDYWMHLQGWEGPHVVIRKPAGKDVPLETLLDAAHLAIYYSKIRGTDYAEVIYTQRKYVRPIKGGPVGSVTYANVSRLAVHPEEQRLRRLLDARRAHRSESE